MKNITRDLHNYAKTLRIEAEAEESKVIGRHRRAESASSRIARNVHRTSVHVTHTGSLIGAGLPAILAFEAARPAWQKFVEHPIAELMFGHGEETHTTAATIAQHFIG